MNRSFSALVDSVTEAFPLRGPVYEFGFSPGEEGASAQIADKPSRSRPSKKAKETPHPTGPFETDGSVEHPNSYNAGSQNTGPEKVGRDYDSIDHLEDLSKLPFSDGSARSILCVGTLEHVFEPRKAVDEMIRILAPGGLFVVGTLGGGASARQPNHCWHFTPNSMQRLISNLDASVVGWQGPETAPHAVFGVGCKGPIDPMFARCVNPFMQSLQKRLDKQAEEAGWLRRIKRRMVDWMCTPDQRRRWSEHYQARFIVHMPITLASKQELLQSCLPEMPGSRFDTK